MTYVDNEYFINATNFFKDKFKVNDNLYQISYESEAIIDLHK